MADTEGTADTQIESEIGKYRPPWTDDEVASLNGFQECGTFHPFTCGNDDCRRQYPEAVLVAGPYGWACRHCDYTQDWAHPFMTDGSWRQHAARMNTFQEMAAATRLAAGDTPLPGSR